MIEDKKMKLEDFLFELDFGYKINDDDTLSLVDFQGANLGNIESDKFDINEKLSMLVVDRVTIYIQDYFADGYAETLRKKLNEDADQYDYCNLLELMKKHQEVFENGIDIMEHIVNPELFDISDILENKEIKARCPRCNSRLKKSSIPDYAYCCEECGEDFYSFECMGVVKCTKELM